MSERVSIPSTVTEADFRAYRRAWNRKIAMHPLWWSYWKVRHLTWRQRRAIRREVTFYAVSLPLGIIEEIRSESRQA